MGAKAKRKPVLAAVLPSNVHILGQPKPRVVVPRHDWHILKEVPGPTHTSGGVVIPDNQRVAECIIVASGPGRMNGLGTIEPMVAKPGQMAIFEGQAKRYAIIDGVEIYAVRDVQIVGIVERNPADTEPAPSAIDKLAAETGLVTP